MPRYGANSYREIRGVLAPEYRDLPDESVEAIVQSSLGAVDTEALESFLGGLKKVGKSVAELEFSRKRIAGPVKKTLESAIANAENNHGLDTDSLIVAEAYVGDALVMKRFMARGRGRSARVEKPFSHLTIVVRQVEETA